MKSLVLSYDICLYTSDYITGRGNNGQVRLIFMRLLATTQFGMGFAIITVKEMSVNPTF